MIIHTMKNIGESMRLRYKSRGQLFPRDVTMMRLAVFLSLGTVRQYAPATAAGWGQQSSSARSHDLRGKRGANWCARTARGA